MNDFQTEGEVLIETVAQAPVRNEWTREQLVGLIADAQSRIAVYQNDLARYQMLLAKCDELGIPENTETDSGQPV